MCMSDLLGLAERQCSGRSINYILIDSSIDRGQGPVAGLGTERQLVVETTVTGTDTLRAMRHGRS